jgi:hypothetical protein
MISPLVSGCPSGPATLDKGHLPVLISYGHAQRHFLPVSKTDVMAILPILGIQSFVCDNKGHH